MTNTDTTTTAPAPTPAETAPPPTPPETKGFILKEGHGSHFVRNADGTEHEAAPDEVVQLDAAEEAAFKDKFDPEGQTKSAAASMPTMDQLVAKTNKLPPAGEVPPPEPSANPVDIAAAAAAESASGSSGSGAAVPDVPPPASDTQTPPSTETSPSSDTPTA